MPKTSTKTQVQLRRAPRLVPFLVTSACVGLLLSLALAVAISAKPGFFGYLVAFGTALVTVIGWIAWIILDAIFARRSRLVSATKIEG